MSDPVAVWFPSPGDDSYRDHVGEMLARLPEQFKAKRSSDTTNNISLLLSALASSVQSLESSGQQVLTQRTLDNAVGISLDQIGKIVGQQRNGLDDDTYRRYCRAAIVSHRSTGIVEDLISVAKLVVFDSTAVYEVSQQNIATIDLRVTATTLSDSIAAILLSFIKKTAATGIRVMLTYGVTAQSTWFRFDSGPGFDNGHLVSRIE